MGSIGNREILVARWAEVINDPTLHDLPYKIELNAESTIEMSPAILTVAGVRVPDVAWGSAFVDSAGVRARRAHTDRGK